MSAFESRAKEIFLDALECDASGRAAFLAQACGQDSALRERVDTLLRGHVAAERSATRADAELAIGSRIDRYLLRSTLGEGGFGIVFLAEQQEPVKREVALKVVKLGMDTRRVVARFEHERQTLASMDHPAIAKVFDAGMTTSGRPYFVMERVQGVPITQYCDAQRLDLRARAALFSVVCRAIEHAHQRGVIHRDIKPSNVLVCDVDHKPVPKVIDFGIAKALARDASGELSMERQVIGTLSAMSPEQLRGDSDLDTRTDVYSLGVLLHQLCTGTTPFDPDDLGHGRFFDAVLHRDPPRPGARALASLAPLPRELDWIVLRCLEKERGRRYSGAAALADDVDRWLAFEPIQAAPPSKVYRLRKFARRHRVATIASLAVLAAIVAGAISSRIAWTKMLRQERIARAVNEFLTTDLLPAVRPSDRPGRGREVSLRAVLDAASAKIADDAAQGGRFEGEPLVVAAIRFSIGQSYLALGAFADALPHLTFAREQFIRDGGEASDLALDSTVLYGMTLRALGRPQEALSPLRAAVEILRHDSRPTDGRVGALVHLALTTSTLGMRDETMALCDEALSLVPDDADPDHQRLRGNIANALANVYELKAAQAVFRRVLEVMRSAFGPDDPDVLGAIYNYAVSLEGPESAAEARALLEDVLPRMRTVFGDEFPDTIMVMRVLSRFRLEQRRIDEADELLTRALGAARKVHGDNHRLTLLLIGDLSRLREEQGRLDEAQTLTREALASAEAAFGEKHVLVVAFLNDLASQTLAVGKDAEAEAAMRRALRLAEEVFGPEHPNTALTRKNLVDFLAHRGRADEAEAVSVPAK